MNQLKGIPEGKERVIMGIDPGTNLMGYGVIECTGQKMKLVALGVVDLKKIADPYEKLHHIFTRTVSLVEQFKPDEIAIEAPFFGKNVQSMLKLGRAQGVAIAAAMYRSVPIIEYAPRKIKMSITGEGAASKEQVAGIIMRLLKITELPTNLDATDALAAAVCHFFQRKPGISEKSVSSWKEFISKNPDKVISHNNRKK